MKVRTRKRYLNQTHRNVVYFNRIPSLIWHIAPDMKTALTSYANIYDRGESLITGTIGIVDGTVRFFRS